MLNQDLIQTLKELGLKRAAEFHSTLGKQKIKMRIAYKNYGYVAREEMERLDSKIRKTDSNGYTERKQRLELVPIEEFLEIPENSVLEKLREAKRKGIFDDFMIVKLEEDDVRMLFGLIKMCGDYFALGSWGQGMSDG